MKYPKEVRTYCPFCKKHTLQKARLASKGKARALAVGNRKHERKLKGHGGKRAGEKSVKKQGKRQKIILECTECKKKQERVIGTRTKKKLEFNV
jgi:large subunit ribosomal protein L44e